METGDKIDLRELLIDAHAHFFFLRGDEATRVKLWQILPNAIVIDTPKKAPMRKTLLGYIPTLDNYAIYEIEGTICTDPLPDQMPNTVRIEIKPEGIKKISRRQFPRVSFAPPINGIAHHAGSKKDIAIKIINFSAGGLRIESDEDLNPSKLYEFCFTVETDEDVHELKLEGSVIYEVPLQRGRSYGVRFGATKDEISVDTEEAPVEELDKTVELMNLVNSLIIKEK